jgi:hypothetical protein
MGYARGIAIITLTAVAALVPQVASGHRVARAAAAGPPPQLLELRYGYLRAPGTVGRSYQVRLKVTDPNGQVVGIRLTTSAGTLKAARGCGLAGRVNGGTTTAFIPVRLRSGLQAVTVVLTSTHCNGRKAGALQRKTFHRRVLVR